MSRVTDYSFDPFLEARSRDWYGDDAVLHRLLARFAVTGAAGDREESATRAFGETAAGLLRELARESALPENRPRLRHFDAYGRRVDEVLLPASTRRALSEAEGRWGLGAPHGDPFHFYARVYLCQQNGEAGVACSLACTDGLVRALEALGDRDDHREAVERVRGSTPERVWHGAQFVTEIQGGSDVPANRVRAVPDGDAFRIHGRKWFCSNVNADYYLVTARPDGAPSGGRGVGLFLVPSHLQDGDDRRNGHVLHRLKEKLGTRELATAEVTFQGARATPVGPLERGLPNLLRYVLTPSRFACVVSSAAFLRRAERIVREYADFRTAFGRRLVEYPLVREQVDEIGRARRRALASVFALLERWEESDGSAAEGRSRGKGPAADLDARREGQAALEFRVMLSLCKTVHSRRATRRLHEAMMILGGNGIEERFSPLPRLYRDAVIMETWEGPHNVLLTQALRDLDRFDVEPEAFVRGVTGEGGAEAAGTTVEALAGELESLLEEAGDPETTLAFARFAPRLVDAFAEATLEATR